MYRQVGNAVPPILGAVAGFGIIACDKAVRPEVYVTPLLHPTPEWPICIKWNTTAKHSRKTFKARRILIDELGNHEDGVDIRTYNRIGIIEDIEVVEIIHEPPPVAPVKVPTAAPFIDAMVNADPNAIQADDTTTQEQREQAPIDVESQPGLPLQSRRPQRNAKRNKRRKEYETVAIRPQLSVGPSVQMDDLLGDEWQMFRDFPSKHAKRIRLRRELLGQQRQQANCDTLALEEPPQQQYPCIVEPTAANFVEELEDNMSIEQSSQP
jgi:hypothetical protein